MASRDEVIRAWRCGCDECEVLVLTLERSGLEFVLSAQYVGRQIRLVVQSLPFGDEAAARVFVRLLFPRLAPSKRYERELSTFVASWY